MSNINGLIRSLGGERIRLNEPLSFHTTLRIGGPADLFFEAKSSGELIKALRLAGTFEVPVTVIGGGSNILVSDLGIRGLVVKNKSGKIEVSKKEDGGVRLPQLEYEIRNDGEKKMARWRGAEEGTMKYDFSDLDYSEDDKPDVEVVMDSGVSLQVAMYKMFGEGVTGLQWYARIPGTIGGAVFNNIHGGSHVFSEIVREVRILDNSGGVIKVPANKMEFEYDKSRIHRSGDVVLEVTLNLKKGDVDKARGVAEEWRKRKSSQPVNSAGCVFKNISEEDRKILGYPTTATGYIIEHILNMTGFGVGGAMISPNHHNFIVNNGGATAKDYLSLRDEIHRRAKETIGINLESEIILLGEF